MRIFFIILLILCICLGLGFGSVKFFDDLSYCGEDLLVGKDFF